MKKTPFPFLIPTKILYIKVLYGISVHFSLHSLTPFHSSTCTLPQSYPFFSSLFFLFFFSFFFCLLHFPTHQFQILTWHTFTHLLNLLTLLTLLNSLTLLINGATQALLQSPSTHDLLLLLLLMAYIEMLKSFLPHDLMTSAPPAQPPEFKFSRQASKSLCYFPSTFALVCIFIVMFPSKENPGPWRLSTSSLVFSSVLPLPPSLPISLYRKSSHPSE